MVFCLPTRIPIMLEFLSSLDVQAQADNDADPRWITFRLASTEHALTLVDLTRAFGFLKNGLRHRYGRKCTTLLK